MRAWRHARKWLLFWSWVSAGSLAGGLLGVLVFEAAMSSRRTQTVGGGFVLLTAWMVLLLVAGAVVVTHRVNPWEKKRVTTSR